MPSFPYERRRSFAAGAMRCPDCEGPLEARRTCLEVRLACDRCQRSWRMEELAARMDDDFEEELGFVPVDRL